MGFLGSSLWPCFYMMKDVLYGFSTSNSHGAKVTEAKYQSSHYMNDGA